MGYAVTQLTRLCDRLTVPHAGTLLSDLPPENWSTDNESPRGA